MVYGLTQIPSGFLLDRVNVKYISLAAISLCTIGAFIFSVSESFATMQFSRSVLAIGSAVSYGISMKVVSSNFTGVKRGVLFGLISTIGVIGAMLGGQIIHGILGDHDWRGAVAIIAYCGIVLFIIALFFSRM